MKAYFELILLALVASWIFSAAAAAEQLVKVHLQDKVIQGRSPRLEVSVFQDLSLLELNLLRDDGKKIHHNRKNLRQDRVEVFELEQRSGRHHYRGSLQIWARNQHSGSMKLDFEAMVLPALNLQVKPKELDLHRNHLLLRAQRALASVQYTITSENGDILAQGEYKPQQPIQPIRLSWKQKPATVISIALLAHDEHGFFETLNLYPWSFSIPHEEVVFASGDWRIAPTEEPKLARSYALLRESLRKYGKLLPVKLYIAGYTDTVSTDDYNRELSEKRAHTIAHYFRQRGFRKPIFYQGLGEKGLKIPTADQVAEAQNRRAEYVLAAEPPPMNIVGSTIQWRRLQ